MGYLGTHRSRWRYLLFTVIAFVAFGIAYKVYGATTPIEGKLYEVIRAIDGDTLVIRLGWKEATVRLLGIDTPETLSPKKPVQCFGKEASHELFRLTSGYKVIVEFNPNREQKDRYGRYLAYVAREDGLALNEHMLMNGFAREYTFGKPYARQKAFRALERMAKASQVGLWKQC